VAVISFDAINQADGTPYRIRLDPASIESVEEQIGATIGQSICLVRSNNGRSYIIAGDFATISERIAPAATRAENIRAFLNSGLGIFLLTTIFVTLGGAVLKWSVEQSVEREKRIGRERSLLVELDTRVAQISARGHQIRELPDDDQKASTTLCIYQLAGGSGDCDSTGTAKGRPLVAIVNELYGLGVKTDPNDVRTTLGQIETEQGEVLNSVNRRVYPDGLLEQRLDVLRAYSGKAWHEIGHS